MLQRFGEAILATSEAAIRSDPTLGGGLVFARHGDIAMSYAPFEHVQPAARIVLVGITPGAQQAANALTSARRDLLAGLGEAEVLARAKAHASFSGAMRGNLVAMLDHVGVARWLGVASASTLWDRDGRLVHFTSALRFPTFLRGANYAGTPAIGSVPMLRHAVETWLADEVAALPCAVWVPLGPAAGAALRMLSDGGALAASRVLAGLPHPSSANGERIAYFLGRKARELLSRKTDPDAIDEARGRLTAKVAGL